jgi:hypothetical protein
LTPAHPIAARRATPTAKKDTFVDEIKARERGAEYFTGGLL